MQNYDIYKDIAARCDGDIYVGVVGPVRSGKSTFITKFMNEIVLPKMNDANKKQRTIDEMPQSAGGRTIMTTQPKFLPDEAVKITFDKNVVANVRLIDCVGYLIEGAMGHMEGESPRQVTTPWSDKTMSFEKAAEFGTQKVIKEHSNIGILITSDGSITDIPRNSYIKAEERVVGELKSIGKPFIMLLNSKNPKEPDTVKMRDSLEEKYSVPVMAIDVTSMSEGDINEIFEKILYEFPVRKITVNIPKWMQALSYDNDMIKSIVDSIRMSSKNIYKIKQYHALDNMLESVKDIESTSVTGVKLGEGKLEVEVKTDESLYYKILSAECGTEISDDFALISYIKDLANAKTQYEKLKNALNEVTEKGYGVVVPEMDELILDPPEIVKQGGKFGVKLKAQAPSLHIMRVDINTEVCPIVGTEEQSEELLEYLLSEFDSNPAGIWETNMFGKSLHMLVKEGLNNKLSAMPEDVQTKMRKTVGRIINEGKGGVLCVLL